MKFRALAILAVGLAGLYGCASTQQKPAAAPAPETQAPAAQPETAPAQTGSEFQGKELDNPNSPLYKKVFYFPFDSSDVSSADRDVLAAHAKYLAANPSVKVEVQGNADERGSREYNLALGERRAQSVQRLLSLQGAKKDQEKVVSFGEERPVATCHEESCWSQNRRVELHYSGY
jgi:peptidoglycan-associated lipoprotein